ncbi:Hypothetical predicted protein [Paramuricea clavata]|uniref:Uncharacterized protein n=1 Tax=Paramuricea clavata TaxID=317549 RepID=A0A6S7G0N9_PARCT|nr:Hypothetical predicted protein [Paramuricea clavata]
MLSFALAQRKASIGKLESSAKGRAKLRQKMSADQKSIDKKIFMFNVIQLAVHGNETPLDECAVVDGMFPWTINDISVRLKCKIMDKFEHLKRLDEELILIKKEMLQYLKYYKDIVISKLKTEIKDLERNLNSEAALIEEDPPGSPSGQDVESEKFLYVSSSCMSRRVILGEMALRYKGIHFAKQQLNSGSKKFSSIYSGDILHTIVNNDSDDDSNYDNEDNDDNDSDNEMINDNTTMDK